MANQALAEKEETPNPATGHPAAGTPAAGTPAADRPAVSLVKDKPAKEKRAEKPKRRGRASSRKSSSRPKAPAKNAAEDILFLVETAENSGQFEEKPISNVVDLLDLLDENRKVITTRDWREL